jgi:hypothetical protein
MVRSSQTVTRDRVADRQREEAERGGHQDDVQHVDAPSNERLQRARYKACGEELCAPLTRDYLSLIA